MNTHLALTNFFPLVDMLYIHDREIISVKFFENYSLCLNMKVSLIEKKLTLILAF